MFLSLYKSFIYEDFWLSAIKVSIGYYYPVFSMASCRSNKCYSICTLILFFARHIVLDDVDQDKLNTSNNRVKLFFSD